MDGDHCIFTIGGVVNPRLLESIRYWGAESSLNYLGVHIAPISYTPGWVSWYDTSRVWGSNPAPALSRVSLFSPFYSLFRLQSKNMQLG